MRTKSIREGNTMNKKILLVNDMPGYGKVALAAMSPILSTMGHSLFNLPTALVSNTLDYKKFEILDTTTYMEKTLAIWEDLGFSFDCIATGFILSSKQVELILSYIEKKKTDDLFVMVDPIMGDQGKLYNGVKEETIDNMRKLSSVADVMIPNFTEACFLAKKYIGKTQITKKEAKDLMQSLLNNGAKSVVITSMESTSKEHFVCGYSKKEQAFFFLPYLHIPVQFPGTGDIFSSILLGSLLHNISLQESVQKAMDVVYQFILKNKDNQDKFRGIIIEEGLDLVKK